MRMDLKFMLTCTISLLHFALSYGRMVIGRHTQDCQPITSLVEVKFPNCLKTSISLGQCFGTCLSWDGLPDNADKPVNRCTCCKPVTFRDRKVFVECIGGNGVRQVEEHTVKEPIACGCTPCSRRKKRSGIRTELPSSLDALAGII